MIINFNYLVNNLITHRHFDELLHIAVEIIEMRQAFEHEEEDAGGITTTTVATAADGNLTQESPETSNSRVQEEEEINEEEVNADRQNPKSDTETGEEEESEEEKDEEEQQHLRVSTISRNSSTYTFLMSRFLRVAGKLMREDVTKRSMITISNSDNLCFPRSLVVARIYCERDNLRTGELHEKWNAVRYTQSELQRELALELTRNVDVTISEEGCGLREIERFQRYLAVDNIAITVYNFSTFRGKKPLYDGIASLERELALRLNIMYYERSRHYNPIINLNAAARCRNYCVPYNIGYRNDKTGHRCPNKCP
ncbi:hypothetical protein ACFW04_014755 [Cataglyphis niger]